MKKITKRVPLKKDVIRFPRNDATEDALPYDLVRFICGFLQIEELLLVSRLNTNWHCAASEDDIWTPLTNRKDLDPLYGSWKYFYVQL